MRDMNKNIIQLREHDLNRGHNKSKEPVYPKTRAEAVEGLGSFMDEHNIGKDVVSVTELPNEGEVGKFYYNSTENKYYVYDSTEGFKPLGNDETPIITDNFTIHKGANGQPISHADNSTDIDIVPDTLYILGDVSNGLTLHLTGGKEAYANQYLGRFTANLESYTFSGSTITPESFTMTIEPNVIIPDNTPDIEDGHTYEFSILSGICLITDITYTSEGE